MIANLSNGSEKVGSIQFFNQMKFDACFMIANLSNGSEKDGLFNTLIE